MYLLIPDLYNSNKSNSIFTSHYVSINSYTNNAIVNRHLNLHPTMYLLIPKEDETNIEVIHDLHPTMYLLIPVLQKNGGRGVQKFTSHYVSINSVVMSS